MCGLAFWLRFKSKIDWKDAASIFPEARTFAKRGPDAQGTLTNKSQSSTFCFPEVRHLLDVQWFSTDVDTEDGLTMLKLILRGTEVVDLPDAHLELQACVLHLRGEAVTAQPCPVHEGGQLLFNGEIYESSRGSDSLDLSSSDTCWLARQLANCEVIRQRHDGADKLTLALRDLLETLHGPFAMAFWSPKCHALFVARDRLGRRSLLAARTASGVGVASVGSSVSWQELPVTGVFVFDLVARSVRQLPWRQPAPFAQPWWWSTDNACDEANLRLAFGRLLSEAVARRVEHVAGAGIRVGLLFSGGLDSTVLAALAAEALPHETIELINVAFDSRAPDRLTALCSFQDLLRQYGPERFRLVLSDIRQEDLLAEEISICRLLGPKATHLDFNIAAALWFAARGAEQPEAEPEAEVSKLTCFEVLTNYWVDTAGIAQRALSGAETIASSPIMAVKPGLEKCEKYDVMSCDAPHPFLDDHLLEFVGRLPIELVAYGIGGMLRKEPVSSLQINQMRHEAIVTFSRMEDAEEALRFPVLNDPSIGLRPWRPKAGQRAPDDVPGEANAPVVPSIPIIASGNMTLESASVLEAKRKREELQDRRKALLSSLTDQLKQVLARINDPSTSDRNREQLQTILANIKDKINALTPVQKEDPAKRRPMPMRPLPYQTTLDNRPRPAVLQLSKLPEEMRGPDGEVQLRDALGDSVEWIREWSEDGSSCMVRFRDRRQAEADWCLF
ncbi:Asparagine synthetase domain-containing protein CG17486 [Durusdinium trenchii]|uniref:Asparagine synthetase domain-containing protein CG17486 n=1 Tax=Durusdinium trenchii TaxID=1381693 RepID=A0ABP0L4D2_9DINO